MKHEDKDTCSIMAHTASEQASGPSPPDAVIPDFCLRTALAQAEDAANKMDLRIKEEAAACAQKVLEAGALQQHVNDLVREHNRLLRHVHQLKQCFGRRGQE